ncbi:MAG TPA: DUF2142 domain-containing protein [Candidatus Saccharimonadales bacterium]|nr:DUF2142 domain-containing protein [Candidatus Saccharimonadales bacterium]
MDVIANIKNRLNAANTFAIIAIVFGILFVFTTPLLWGADETTHFGRVYQITQGHIRSVYIGDVWGTGYGGYIPANLFSFIKAVDADLLHPNTTILDTRRVGTPNIYNQFGDQKFSKQKVIYSFPNTATYSPVAYAPSVVGVFITEKLNLNIASMIYAGRLCDLAFYILCVYFALKILRFTRTKWIIFTVALLPMALFQASIITADTTTNAVAILFAALIIKSLIYKKPLSKLESILLLLLAIVLPLVKPIYVFFDFLILFIPKQLLRISRGTILKILALVVGLIGFVVWSYITRNVTDAVRLMRGDFWQSISPPAQIKYAEHHIITAGVIVVRTVFLQDNTYLSQLIGWLGFDYVPAPAMAIISSLGAMGLAFLIIDKAKLSKKHAYAILAVILACFVTLFATLYITFTRVKYPEVEGVQGRYFIPLLPLLLVVPGVYISNKIISGTSVKYRFICQLIVCLVLFSLTVSALKFIYVTWY